MTWLRSGPMSRSRPVNASVTTNRWYMKNALAMRKVTAAALRMTKLVSGSAMATNAPTRSTVKIGSRIISVPRTHRPRYIWPSPGRSKERTAAKPGEPVAEGPETERARGKTSDDAPRFDTEPLAYETRPPEDGAPASDRLRHAARRSRRRHRLRHAVLPPRNLRDRLSLG